MHRVNSIGSNLSTSSQDGQKEITAPKVFESTPRQRNMNLLIRTSSNARAGIVAVSNASAKKSTPRQADIGVGLAADPQMHAVSRGSPMGAGDDGAWWGGGGRPTELTEDAERANFFCVQVQHARTCRAIHVAHLLNAASTPTVSATAMWTDFPKLPHASRPSPSSAPSHGIHAFSLALVDPALRPTISSQKLLHQLTTLCLSNCSALNARLCSYTCKHRSTRGQ